jgi:hypothetical protein
MDWLISLYIGTGIFGLGITIIDFIGMLDDNDGDDSGEDGADDGHDLGLIDDAGADASDNVSDDIEGDGDPQAEGEEDGEDLEGEESGSKVALQQKSGMSHLIKTLQVLRFLVYFSLGFGPIGFIGTLLSYPWWEILLVALGLGTITSLMAFWVKRLLGKTTDSQVHNKDMIMEKATVTVSISPGEIGKVRTLRSKADTKSAMPSSREGEKRFPQGQR